MQIGFRYRVTLTLLCILALSTIIGIWFLSPSFSLHGHLEWVLLTYGALLLSAWLFPIRLGEQSVTITLGIELPLFLQFGPVITIITANGIWLLSQWLSGRSIRPRRLIANLSMFTIMIGFASFGYRLAGGALPPILWSSPLVQLVVPSLIYVTVHFLVNYAITLWIAWSDTDRRIDSWTLGVLWDLSALLGEMLLAALLIDLQHLYGLLALFLTAIPFAGLIYMYRLYSNLLIANRQLSNISDITMNLSVELHELDLCNKLLQGAMRLVSANACYLFVEDETEHLSPLAVLGQSPEMEAQMRKVRFEMGQSVIGAAYESGEIRVQRSMKQATPHASTSPELFNWSSVLAIPLRYNDQTIGVLTLTHVEKRAFSKRNEQTLQILANQAAIGLHNAKRFAESTEQSLIDPLTGLFNYRYFESAVDKHCRKADHTESELALLVLDIDHFKQINDSYGHLVGNQVLNSFANLIKEQVRDEDIVCRYGGEEFTVILPGAGIEIGMQIAERLRHAVESTPVHIPSSGNTTLLPIRLTVSVGAAAYPTMADSPQDLLRKADRAMYVGSKQKGRNRVALYEQNKGS